MTWLGADTRGPRRSLAGTNGVAAVPVAAALAATLLASGLWLSGCSTARSPVPERQVVLAPHDRVLILAPHPDDETLGTGGAIREALVVGAAVRVVYLTYGDSDEWSFMAYRKIPVVGQRPVMRMGEIRRDEALAACDTLGVRAGDVAFLGYPDFGTLAIWREHWGDSRPLRGLFSGAVAVPYGDAYRPGAPYKGEEILRDLTAIIRDFRPTKLFVSHPSDQNPDHEALYLFTLIALWDLSGETAPEVLPYLVHFPHWPVPFGRHPRGHLEPPEGLARDIVWRDLVVSQGVESLKEAALSAHRTQMDYAARRLLSFVRTNEIFGDYEEVALTDGTEAASMLAAGTGGSQRTQAELTLEERAAFVGFEERWVALQADTLILSVTFSRPLSRETSAEFEVYGYRSDVPFAEMPKLNIGLGHRGERVADQTLMLPKGTVKFRRDGRRVTVRVPLSLLGAPDKVVLGGRTRAVGVPLDWAAWRAVALPHGVAGSRPAESEASE